MLPTFREQGLTVTLTAPDAQLFRQQLHMSGTGNTEGRAQRLASGRLKLLQLS